MLLWFLGKQFKFYLHWSWRKDGLHINSIMIMHLNRLDCLKQCFWNCQIFWTKVWKRSIFEYSKSLYWLKQAPRTFFEKLKTRHFERVFEKSDFDPCLFMKNGICVVYVDDTIFAGENGEELEWEIASLGVQSNKVIILSSCVMRAKLGIS